MAHSKLHLICGNCGCNDSLQYQIVKDGIDIDGINFKDAVWIHCNNCSTLHSLDSFIPEREKKTTLPKNTRGIDFIEKVNFLSEFRNINLMHLEISEIRKIKEIIESSKDNKEIASC